MRDFVPRRKKTPAEWVEDAADAQRQLARAQADLRRCLTTRNRVIGAANNAGVSRAELARATGLTRQAVDKIIHPERYPRKKKSAGAG